MTLQSHVTRIRIIAPPNRVKDPARLEEARHGDTIEIVDRPIYRVDPKTRQSTRTLQPFKVTGTMLGLA